MLGHVEGESQLRVLNLEGTDSDATLDDTFSDAIEAQVIIPVVVAVAEHEPAQALANEEEEAEDLYS